MQSDQPKFSKKDFFFFFRVAFLTEITEDRDTWEKKTEESQRSYHCSWFSSHSFIATVGAEQKGHCINTLPHKNNCHGCSSGKQTEVWNMLRSNQK